MIGGDRRQTGLARGDVYLGLEGLAIRTKNDIGKVNCWLVSIDEGQPNGDYGWSGVTWSSRDELGYYKSIPY